MVTIRYWKGKRKQLSKVKCKLRGRLGKVEVGERWEGGLDLMIEFK